MSHRAPSIRSRMTIVGSGIVLALSLVSAPVALAQEDGPDVTIQNLLAAIEAKDFEALPSFFCEEFAAQAAANAIQTAVCGKGDQLDVTGATITEAFGKRTVFVQVSALYIGQRRELMGFCLIDPDPSRAAALAVLNAVNRFLGIG